MNKELWKPIQYKTNTLKQWFHKLYDGKDNAWYKNGNSEFLKEEQKKPLSVPSRKVAPLLSHMVDNSSTHSTFQSSIFWAPPWNRKHTHQLHSGQLWWKNMHIKLSTEWQEYKTSVQVIKCLLIYQDKSDLFYINQSYFLQNYRIKCCEFDDQLWYSRDHSVFLYL